MRVDSIRHVLALKSAVAAVGLLCLANPALAQAPSNDPAPPPSNDPAPAPAPPTDPAPAQAPATEPAPPPAASTTLHGIVIGEDGSPQAGATVTIAPTGTVVFTDDKGEYTVPVHPGTYTVRVEMLGRSPFEKTVTVGDAPATLDFQMSEDRLGEVIMIVGSRTPRSRLETSVPVDVVTSDVITESSHTETNQILNTIAPSFNASHQAITDGTDHIDPAELRGLGPEHVLVLINGKRLHQSSLINVFTGGTVGVDLNAIPTSAITRIEVLRDGAASQYGSDAIAGVINIVLKDNVNALDLYTMTGITGSNDGVQFKLGANLGTKLGDRGFLNVTGELFSRGRTNRSKPWPDDIFTGITGKADTDAELARRGKTRADFTMDVGTAGALVGTTFLNAGYKLDDTFELHAHGGYTIRKGNASGFYRLPRADFENRVDLGVYENGFLPEINPLLQAWTATAGVHAKNGPWDGDLSLTYGGDSFHFFVDNSLNASLGAMSPLNFDAGRLRYHQTSLNLDGVRKIDQKAIKAVSVVGGAELRRETYGITAGQPESYELGPVLNSAGEPKSPGSQVFPGFRPDDDPSNNPDYAPRLSEALYAGVETQPTARTNVDLGARFEHYNDFGNTLTGKLAGRVSVVKRGDNELALRGSASTGFRAPGLQQIWYSTISTQFVNDPATGTPTPINILISPNLSQVTEAFGAPRLKEETSVNFSGGFTTRLFGNLSLSADYYHVTMKDRVVLSGLFDTQDPMIGATVSSIVSPFPGVAAAQFFINAVDTTTNGVDVVVDYTHRLSKGSLKATAAANFTNTNVDDVHVPDSMKAKFPGSEARVEQVFLGRYGENRIEDVLPRQKGTLGLRWDYGGFSAGVRGNFFGPTEYHSDTPVDPADPSMGYLDESFGAEATFDVDVGYRIGGLWWSVGANNVFNHFPDEVKRPENRYSDSFLYAPASVPAGSPYGIDGGFYYLRVEYKR